MFLNINVILVHNHVTLFVPYFLPCLMSISRGLFDQLQLIYIEIIC